jgi:hypothetical protein
MLNERKPSFIPTPSPFATPNRQGAPLANHQGAPLANRVNATMTNHLNKTNIKVKTTIRINKTDTPKNLEPIPKSKIIQLDRQATNYIEICIILFIFFIIYRFCRKLPVKNPRYNEALPIHTPPSSPDNKRNPEVYYAFHPNTSSIYRRSNSSNSLT